MSERELHRLPAIVSEELKRCFDLFRPEGEPLEELYDHLVGSNLIGMLVGPTLSEHQGVGATEWFRLWRETADEMVPDHVHADYSARDLEQARARANCVFLGWSMGEDGRERLLYELATEFSES